MPNTESMIYIRCKLFEDFQQPLHQVIELGMKNDNIRKIKLIKKYSNYTFY